MSWGFGGWGVDEWGTDPLPAGTLPPPTLDALTPADIDELGGDVITIVGTNFEIPLLVEFLQGGVVIGASTNPESGYVETIADGVARGTIVNPTYDVTSTRAYVGTPALPAGTYDIRVTTQSGTSAELAAAIVSKPMAAEHRVHSMRSKWARAWQVGPRWLTGG